MVDTGGKRTFALTGLGFADAKTSVLGSVTPNFGLCVSDLSGIWLSKENKTHFWKKKNNSGKLLSLCFKNMPKENKFGEVHTPAKLMLDFFKEQKTPGAGVSVTSLSRAAVQRVRR